MEGLSTQRVNEIIKEWRQGDCVLDSYHFLFGYNPKLVLTPISTDEHQSDEIIVFAQEEVIGFSVVTQTCDVVSPCKEKPYVELAPLCIAPSDKFGLIRKHRMPGYAIIPALEDRKIIVDLDRTMTVEKPVLAEWNNTKILGCRNTEEAVLFSWALSRKRSRFAFPEEFMAVFKPFIKRILEKHDKNTDEGRMLREFEEIRVRATPDWWSKNCIVTFLFFLKGNSEFNDWSAQIEDWKKLIKYQESSYAEPEMFVVDYDNPTARDYKESIPLDLYGLSASSD